MGLNLWKFFHCEVIQLQKNLEKLQIPWDTPASKLESSSCICEGSIQILYHQSYTQGSKSWSCGSSSVAVEVKVGLAGLLAC